MFDSFKLHYSRVPSFQQIQGNSSTPSRIFLQIVILQVFYYLTAIILFFATAQLLGLPFSFKWCFSWQWVSLENTLGLTLAALWLFDSLLSVFFITIIIGRSKLAWDYALTVHVVNLALVWLNSGFPTSLYWWLLQICSCAIMITLGTWTTRWKELRETFFDGIADTELGQMHESASTISAATTAAERK